LSHAPREHRGTPHAVGIEPRRSRHRLDHESFQRPLAQLADQQAEQEFLLLLGGLREHPGLCRGGARAPGPGHALERRIHAGELLRGVVRRPLGARGPERRVSDSEPSLAYRS
jgi:hypothetical protein